MKQQGEMELKFHIHDFFITPRQPEGGEPKDTTPLEMPLVNNITSHVIQEYIDGHYRPVTEELGEFRRQSEALHVPVIMRETERLLAVILRMTSPKQILEVGTAAGYSACFFAAVCGPKTQITTLESDMERCRDARENIRLLGYQDQIRVIPGDAAETAAKIETTWDLVFIDAGKSHYLQYWNALINQCRPGTVIICDNVLMHGKTAHPHYDPRRKFRTNIKKMRAFVEMITGSEELETTLLSSGDGLSISILKGNTDSIEIT